MIIATESSAISRLVMKAMKRGRPINLFWKKEDYEAQIQKNALYYTPLETGLALWLDRGDHYRLYFSMDGTEPLPPTEKPTVTELVFAEEECIPPCLSDWERLFERVRLSRPPMESALPTEATFAEPCHFDQIKQILQQCFDHLTGCLPTDDELMQDLQNNKILAYFDGQAPIALLHFSADGKRAEIRHFATLESARGQGCGKQLLAAFLNLHSALPCSVWVRKGNAPALHLYEKFGFSADGRNSLVLKRKDENQ